MSSPPGIGERRRHGFRRFTVTLSLFFVLIWLLGLIWFAETIPDTVEDPDSTTDAIVVLTGGSQRIQAGLQLLAAGKAKKLFVSGVSPGVDIDALLRVEGQGAETNTRDFVPCCIVLGHTADNTFGNALETATFMRDADFHSLRLVTASYHLRRSLLEFSRVMPDVTILPNPVFPENVKQERWWAWPGTLWLIIGEYNKYLAALVRPMAFRLLDKVGLVE